MVQAFLIEVDEQIYKSKFLYNCEPGIEEKAADMIDLDMALSPSLPE